jgi:hypothetical protein
VDSPNNRDNKQLWHVHSLVEEASVRAEVVHAGPCALANTPPHVNHSTCIPALSRPKAELRHSCSWPTAETAAVESSKRPRQQTAAHKLTCGRGVCTR